MVAVFLSCQGACFTGGHAEKTPQEYRNSRRNTCSGYNELAEMEIDVDGLSSGDNARLENYQS